MPFNKRDCQRGSIATIVALFGLGVISLGIIAGKTLVEQGGRFLPKAQTPGAVTDYYLPSADSYVDQTSPGSNYGKANTIQVSSRSGQIRESYLQFNIDKLAGPVLKAELRLVAGDDERKNSPAVYLTDSNWAETGITYTNKPARGPKIADTRIIETRRPVTIDVTKAITGNGTFSFVLIGGQNTIVRFNSREAVINKPTLTIIYQPPSPTLTPSKTPTKTPILTPIATISATATPAVLKTPTPTPACTDTDGGINLYEQGVVEGLDQNGNSGSYTDVCVYQTNCFLSPSGCSSSYTLNEGHCRTRDNGTKYFSITARNCALGCANGACINSGSITPTRTPTLSPTPSPTPIIMCTPPACPSGQVYFCALGNCPGGCGTTCANPTITPVGGLKPGDANEDGYVDGVDYNVWLQNYNTVTDQKHKKGDFNADGKVDGLDYIVWLTNYLSGPTPTTGPSLTPTITTTPSVTPALAPSISPTITLTPSPTATVTPTPTLTPSPTDTPTPTITPTLTPVPTCIPLPVCAYEGIPDGQGGKIYCDLPNANYCPKPTPTNTPTPVITCTPRPPCADGIVDQYGYTIYCLPPNTVIWCPKPTPSPTPTIPVPTCIPLPDFCLGSSNDGDPINICTWLDQQIYCLLTQKPRCNQSCSITNPCASGFTCTGIIPITDATGSAVTPTYLCRKADKPYDSTCSN